MHNAGLLVKGWLQLAPEQEQHLGLLLGALGVLSLLTCMPPMWWVWSVEHNAHLFGHVARAGLVSLFFGIFSFFYSKVLARGSLLPLPPGGTRRNRGRRDFSRFDPRPQSPHFSKFGAMSGVYSRLSIRFPPPRPGFEAHSLCNFLVFFV